MKTKYFSVKGAIVKSFVGLLGLTAISCGSYKNVSYYENDGIYGSDQREPVSQTQSNNDDSNKKYKEY